MTWECTFEDIEKGLHISLCMYSLELAALAIDARHGRRRWKYTLVVPPEMELTAKKLLKELGSLTQDNPLAPYVNLRVETGQNAEPTWWFVCACSESDAVALVVNVGSVGC